MARYAHDDASVAVIIGSGAGGGTLANELCQKGVPVVVLEAGKRQTTATFVNDEWPSFNQLASLDKRTTSGTWRVAKDFPNLPTWVCKTVGGTTTHWAGASLRIQPHEFKARTTYREVAQANFEDWPITREELDPYYARAEAKLGVTRTNAHSGLPGNNNFKVMYNGAKKIGYHKCSTGHMAINSKPHDGRIACMQLGFCFQGCKSGAKWSTLYTEIPHAEATGKLDLRPESHVLRIEHDGKKATAVVYVDAEGKEQRQRARIVAVAGNSIETPRLLLNSATSARPDGLANSSGQVGKNYMRHLTGSVYGIFDEPVHMYRGTTMAGIVQDEVEHKPSRGFVGGYEMETISLGLPFFAAFLDPGAWGSDFAMFMDNYAARRRHVDRRRGYAARVKPRHADHRREGPARHARAERALRRPSQRPRDARACVHARLAHLPGRRRQTLMKTPPYPSTHNLGTARMTADKTKGVVNAHGQSHDVANLFISDGSQFTTSAAENPTLTIVTLAIRQAEYITSAMSKQLV